MAQVDAESFLLRAGANWLSNSTASPGSTGTRLRGRAAIATEGPALHAVPQITIGIDPGALVSGWQVRRRRSRRSCSASNFRVGCTLARAAILQEQLMRIPGTSREESLKDGVAPEMRRKG